MCVALRGGAGPRARGIAAPGPELRTWSRVGHRFTIAAAIRLLGAGLILVGLSPRVVLTIVQLDVRAPDFKVLRDLREAVATVVRRV